MKLQGTPIASSWDLSVKSTSCINIHAVYYVNNSLNIVSDIAILVLPIPMIWQLQLPKRQRVGILAIFMTGGALVLTISSCSPGEFTDITMHSVCIISIIRLWTLYDLIKSTDTTCTLCQLHWRTIEISDRVFRCNRAGAPMVYHRSECWYCCRLGFIGETVRTTPSSRYGPSLIYYYILPKVLVYIRKS